MDIQYTFHDIFSKGDYLNEMSCTPNLNYSKLDNRLDLLKIHKSNIISQENNIEQLTCCKCENILVKKMLCKYCGIAYCISCSLNFISNITSLEKINSCVNCDEDLNLIPDYINRVEKQRIQNIKIKCPAIKIDINDLSRKNISINNKFQTNYLLCQQEIKISDLLSHLEICQCWQGIFKCHFCCFSGQIIEMEDHLIHCKDKSNDKNFYLKIT